MTFWQMALDKMSRRRKPLRVSLAVAPTPQPDPTPPPPEGWGPRLARWAEGIARVAELAAWVIRTLQAKFKDTAP